MIYFLFVKSTILFYSRAGIGMGMGMGEYTGISGSFALRLAFLWEGNRFKRLLTL